MKCRDIEMLRCCDVEMRYRDVKMLRCLHVEMLQCEDDPGNCDPVSCVRSAVIRLAVIRSAVILLPVICPAMIRLAVVRMCLASHEPAARGGFQTTQNLNQPSRTHSPTSRIHSKNIANAAGPSNPNKPQRAHERAFATATAHGA